MIVWTEYIPASLELKHKHIQTHMFHHLVIEHSDSTESKSVAIFRLRPASRLVRSCTESEHVSQNYSILCNNRGFDFFGLYGFSAVQCVCVWDRKHKHPFTAQSRKLKPLRMWPSGWKVLVCITEWCKGRKTSVTSYYLKMKPSKAHCINNH